MRSNGTEMQREEERPNERDLAGWRDMSIPTHGETYAKLIEHLRLAQEDAAMLAHLRAAEGDDKGKILAHGWLTVSEALKLMQHKVGLLAQARLQ